MLAQRAKELDEELMEHFPFLVGETSKERVVHRSSRCSNLLQFALSTCGQFHNVTSPVMWIGLSFDERWLFEQREQCY